MNFLEFSILSIAMFFSTSAQAIDDDGSSASTTELQALENLAKEAKANVDSISGPSTEPSKSSPEPLGKREELLRSMAKEVEALRSQVTLERINALNSPKPFQVKPRASITTYNFQEGQVYTINCAPERITDIQLKVGETLTTAPTAGDTLRWKVALIESGVSDSKRTHIIVKPVDPDVETNLIIPTTERTYHLRLVSGAIHMPLVAWNYADDLQTKDIKRFITNSPKEKVDALTVRLDRIRYRYEIRGDKIWKPQSVFDDGEKTYLQFGPEIAQRDLPALFIQEPGESELILANYRVKGTYMIVDRLFDRAELRVGPNKKVNIYTPEGRPSFFERIF